MKFNELLLDKLGSIFKKYKLSIAEQFDDYIKLESKYITLIIVHNKRENSNILWIGKNNNSSDKIEIDNEVMKEIFNSSLQLSSVIVQDFINNLVIFFEEVGKPILEGDYEKLMELEKFTQERNKQYTLGIIEQQNLKIADEAWEKKNYKMFVQYLNKIDKIHLPRSYHLKYKIANKKIKM